MNFNRGVSGLRPVELSFIPSVLRLSRPHMVGLTIDLGIELLSRRQSGLRVRWHLGVVSADAETGSVVLILDFVFWLFGWCVEWSLVSGLFRSDVWVTAGETEIGGSSWGLVYDDAGGAWAGFSYVVLSSDFCSGAKRNGWVDFGFFVGRDSVHLVGRCHCSMADW